MTTPDIILPAALSPLADPVIGSIFCDYAHAGSATASLAGAVLIKDGITLGRVLSVSPQRHYQVPGERGVRIDVEAILDSNKYVFLEIQLDADPSILHRNLLSASRLFAAKTPPGARPRDLRDELPRVIVINILNYNLRHAEGTGGGGVAGNAARDYLQPVKLLYTKAPSEVAFDTFAIYNIQLPRFRETPADFGDNLYCWLYALDTAHREGKTMEEVIRMTPQLQTFAKADEGFTQFCEQYHRVATDPRTRDEYFDWWVESARIDAIMAHKVSEARRETRAETMAETNLKAARAVLAMGHTPEEVARALGLPLADVLALR